MGSGKTTLGKQVAKLLAVPFYDVDHLIELETKCSVAEFFASQGEEAFREMERRVLHRLLNEPVGIISVGGGLPCFFDNMQVMNAAGITLYLKLSVTELANRLARASHTRPLLKDKTTEELATYIAQMLEKREPFYQLCQFSLTSNRLRATDIVQALEERRDIVE